MKFLRQIRVNGLSRGLALSLLLHGLVLAALLITLPTPEPEPEEQAVEVTLVEPPEQLEADQPEPEQPEPEQLEPEPPAPEPPAPEQPEAEPAAPEPPEVEQPEPESPEPEAPEPEAAQPEQAASEPPPAPDGEAAPIPVLRPVFRFGEEESGPRQALDGDSAQAPGVEAEAAEPPPETVEAEPAAPAQPEPAQPESAQPEPAVSEPAEPAGPEAPEPAGPDASEVTGAPLPEIDLPQSGLPQDALPEADPDAVAPPTETAGPGQVPNESSTPPPGETEASTAAPTELAEADAPGLAEAGKLFSPVLTENRAAMVAMGSLPRELRASQLCTTELREQLRNAPARYGVELLPSYRLDSGNVLTVADAAFRADGAWYDLSFRCTVDDQALQVTGFALKIGQPIPRATWKSRGFPDF